MLKLWTLINKKCSNMQNLVRLFILILSNVLASNVLLSQDRQLPDFSKAQKISHEQLKQKTLLIATGAEMRMVNACEVGKYDVTLYFEKDSIVYEVVSFEMCCMNRGVFSDYPRQEQIRLSSGIDGMGLGHWYAVCRIGCGKIFEYEVNKFGVVRYEYEMNCK